MSAGGFFVGGKRCNCANNAAKQSKKYKFNPLKAINPCIIQILVVTLYREIGM